jgi:hypothetical protein
MFEAASFSGKTPLSRVAGETAFDDGAIASLKHLVERIIAA